MPYCQAHTGNGSWEERGSVVDLCHARNWSNPTCSPEKMGSAPGGLCTTGLQDRDVSTMAAIISSISTASDFLDSNEWRIRLLPRPTGLQGPQIKPPHPPTLWDHLTLICCPLTQPPPNRAAQARRMVKPTVHGKCPFQAGGASIKLRMSRWVACLNRTDT